MPRMARVVIPNMPHHVVQRGHNRRAVFIEPSDYLYYLDTLSKWKEKLGVKVYSWCLMTNHVHLILDPGDDCLSIGLLMKRLAGRQTRYVNKKENRTGSLWEGRYKLRVIDKDEYLLQCSRYIDLNPVKAAIVLHPEDYRWSGYAAKVGLSQCNIIDLDTCYMAFKDPSRDYRKFVAQGTGLNEGAFISRQLERNQLTGAGKFVDQIEHRTGIRIEPRIPGRPRKR
jgi:putative transposase